MPNVDVCEARCNFFDGIDMVFDPLPSNCMRASYNHGDRIWEIPVATNVFAFFVDMCRLNLADVFALEARVVDSSHGKNLLERGGWIFVKASRADCKLGRIDALADVRIDRCCYIRHCEFLCGFRSGICCR